MVRAGPRVKRIESAWFLHELRKAGVNRMLTAERWIDFRRMEDRILFGITQDASNHPYVRDLSMTTLRGRITAAKEGYWGGGVDGPAGRAVRGGRHLQRPGYGPGGDAGVH